MTVAALAAITGIPARTLSHWLATGRIKGHQQRGRRRWLIDAMDAERVKTWAKAKL